MSKEAPSSAEVKWIAFMSAAVRSEAEIMPITAETPATKRDK